MKNLKVNKIDANENYSLNKKSLKLLGKGAAIGVGCEAVMNTMLNCYAADSSGYVTIKAANGVINLALGAVAGLCVAGIILIRNIVREDSKKEEEQKIIKR